ncbi:MAG: DUF1592 domain-containing protein, partial [Myxococcales bacterium]|nr:DUF1592 domain-containing protein [Myxococcales bacterium]
MSVISWRRGVLAAAASAWLAVGCVGEIGDGSPSLPPGLEGQAPTTAIPRLSRREIDATIEDVFGIAGAAEKYLPADPELAVNPVTKAEQEVFDTLSATKTPSQVFVDGLESLAFAVARDFAADTAKVDALAGCAPSSMATGVSDPDCLRQLVERAGLRLWRRPLTGVEIQTLVDEAAPFASDPAAGSQGHYVAARAAVAALIVSPELVYRTEIGQPLGSGVVALDAYELIARLAYFLWGTAPSPELLAQAGSGALGDAALEALVDDMLADPRAETQMRTFHQLWLRYTRLLITDEAMAIAMRAESDALVDRALSPERWTELFTATETYVTPELATHYGLPAPSDSDWVAYDGERAGLLAHGSFLSLSQTKLTETLPSRRGAMIGRRLLCEVVRPPPPNVAADMGVKVPAGSCKSDAYEAHASGSCKGCHELIDGIGFGFERFDGQGRYREIEAENTSCSIDGQGIAAGQAFSGPRAFSEANLEQITSCAVTHLLQFAVRDWTLSDAWLDRLGTTFRDAHHDFRSLVRA